MTGKHVHAIRNQLGLTQAELAEKVGVRRETITRWETGRLGIRESAARLLTLLAEQHVTKTR